MGRLLDMVLAHANWIVLWRPDVLLAVGFLGCAYAAVIGHVPRRSADRRPPTRKQQIAAVAALLTLYVAIGSPLNLAAQQTLFSALILQMMLLTLVLPQLVLAAIPASVVDPLLQSSRFRRLLAAACHPLVAPLVYAALASGFLLPGNVTANLRDNLLHLAEMIALLLAALCLWWPLCSRSAALPRLAGGGQLLYLLFAANFMMPIAVALLFADVAWYPVYALAPLPVGWSALADQQLGALLMLGGMMLVYGLRALRPFLLYTGGEWYG